MHAAYVLVALVSAAAPRAADIPREPGVWWEQVSEVKGAGVQMPPQTTKVCMPKKQDFSQPPRQQEGAGDCKFTDVKRAGSKLTWKLVCADASSGGDGEIVWSGDTYTSKSTMRTPMGQMIMTARGKKVGGDCDANQYRRELAGRVDDKGLDEALQEACDGAIEEMDATTFATIPQCGPKKKAAFCARLGTAEGQRLVREQGDEQAQAAARLCGGKGAGKGGAAAAPARAPAAPAAVPAAEEPAPAPSKVDQGKKILKGLFGR